jgi:hypothetical protein
MSRSDIPNVADRRPFYLYVDEFQNFATDSFSVILSEARKYGLNLTIANQYVSQMTESVRNAVFGNVGTIISFRVSVDDAPTLTKQFEPEFEEGDLIQMNNRYFVINMIVNGEKTRAFSATTLSIPPAPDKTVLDKITESSRRKYARPKEEVEKEIADILSSASKFMDDLRTENKAREFESLAEQSSSMATGIRPERMKEKPRFLFVPTPQTEFHKQKISPNKAEQKSSVPNLKDLKTVIAKKISGDKPNEKN